MPIYKQVQEITNIGYEYLEHSNGSKVWYKDGKYHREDGPAFISSNGSKSWYKDGKYHREGGPAVIFSNGTKVWYKDGKLHREDGPAIEWKDGNKEWFLEGTKVPEDEFNKVLNAPLKDLPLYINTEFEPIVKERLLNERTNL